MVWRSKSLKISPIRRKFLNFTLLGFTWWTWDWGRRVGRVMGNEYCSACALTRYTVHGRGAKTLEIWNLKSEHFWEKSSKKSFKNWSKYFSFAKDIYTLATFLQKVSKPVFQNLTVERHVSTPHIRLAKVTENPDERTNGRNIWFWLSTDILWLNPPLVFPLSQTRGV